MDKEEREEEKEKIRSLKETCNLHPAGECCANCRSVRPDFRCIKHSPDKPVSKIASPFLIVCDDFEVCEFEEAFLIKERERILENQ